MELDRCDLEVLVSSVDRVIIGRAEPESVKCEIEQCLRCAEEQGDEGLACSLYLLLGRVLLAMGQAQESQDALVRAVQCDTNSARAWIALAGAHIVQDRLDEAERCLSNAQSLAESANDPSLLVECIDAFLLLYSERADYQAQSDAVDSMVRIIDSEAEVDRLPFGSAHMLIEQGESALAAACLSSFVRHSLRGAKAGWLYASLRLLVTAYRQMGLSDSEIALTLSAFVALAQSSKAMRMLTTLTDRAIKCR